MQYLPNIFGSISFSPKAIVDLVFFVVSLFVAVMSVILFFHWQKYGMGGRVLRIFEALYFVGAVFFIVMAFINLN